MCRLRSDTTIRTAAVAAVVAIVGAAPAARAAPPAAGPRPDAVLAAPLAAPAPVVTLTEMGDSGERDLVTVAPGFVRVRSGRGDGTFGAPSTVRLALADPSAAVSLGRLASTLAI